ncbi:BlaI/MecI/CopY family transcriptional regulator [soil metagenome]
MKITAAESLVMDALWRRSPQSAEDLLAELGEAQDWTLATVRTLAGRLVKKNAVATELDGRRYLFRPLVQRDAYVLTESQGLLDRLFDGEVTPLIAHFARHRALTPDDVRKLKQLIAELDDERA